MLINYGRKKALVDFCSLDWKSWGGRQLMSLRVTLDLLRVTLDLLVKVGVIEGLMRRLNYESKKRIQKDI